VSLLHFRKKYENLQVFSKRSLRDYEVDFGANVFGSITQVNERLLKPYYNRGFDRQQGVEEVMKKSYEE
jgi:penicillin-binding protein 2